MHFSEDNAKKTVLELYRSIDWSNGTNQGIYFPIEAFRKAREVTADITALKDGRLSATALPMDFYAPSFWHAASYLLSVFLIQRLSKKNHENIEENFSNLFGNIAIYRGQSSPWNIIPSAWRQSNPEFQKENKIRLEAFNQFVSTFMTDQDDLGFDVFGKLDTVKKAEALAQHYALNTNLVDFTFDPLIALYFASSESEHKSGEIAGIPGNCGVVYTTSFYKAISSSNFHFSLPPAQLTRLINQCGLFIDFGERPASVPATLDFSEPWMYLQQNCSRLFFNRNYPKEEAHDTFTKSFVLPADPFIEETIIHLKNVDVMATPIEEVVKELGFRQTKLPSWKTRHLDSASRFIYTDDEFVYMVSLR
jgi:hypothetical protein